MTFHEIREATQNDQILAKVCDVITNNRWRSYKNDIHIKPYYVLRKELIFHDGVILRKQKLVIPLCLRHSVLRLAHEGHIGIVKFKARLHSKVWWPHIDSEVSPFISECHLCQTTLDHHHPARMMPIPMPESPSLSVAVDLCGPFPTGETLLILVDYYSRFPFVEILKSTTSATIISKSFKIFSVHGLPETLTSDNGGQFTSNEMESFLKINGITHTRNTPLWPQAKGQVERINRVIKKAIQAAINKDHYWKHELDTFLLSYRNTPHCTTGETPSFLLFSRTVRDKLPTVPGTEEVSRHNDAVKGNRAQKEKMKTYADMKRRAKPTELKAGDNVLVKHTGTKDKLTSYWTNDLFTLTKVNGPTIIVRRKRDGKVFARNISMIKKYKHNRDSDDYSVIDSSDSAGMNTETPDPDDGESNVDSVENVGSADNVRRSSRTRNPPIRFGEAYTH